MTSMVAQPAIRLPVPTLALGALAPALVAGVAATGLWWTRSGAHGEAAMLGAGVATVASLVWVAVVALLPARPAFGWSVVLISGSSARLMISLAIGAGIYMAMKPMQVPFWGAFLLVSLVTLAIETLVSVSALKRLASATTNAEDLKR